MVSMEFVLLFSAMLVAALLVTLLRVISLRRMLGYATYIDIVFSLSVFWVFAGSFAGMAAAAVSGLLMAVLLSVMRLCCGYERLCYISWYLRTPEQPEKFRWVRTPRKYNFRMPKIRMQVY